MTLKEVGIVLEDELDIRRIPTVKEPYIVSFKHAGYIRSGIGIIAPALCGRGSTEAEAKIDFCKNLRGLRLHIIDDVRNTYREIQLPPEITEK